MSEILNKEGSFVASVVVTPSPSSDGSHISCIASVSSSHSNDGTLSTVSEATETVNSNGKCVICEDVAHGMHFGALACRACAAFFRRSTIDRRKYVCRFQEQCNINKEIRFCCRYCRLKKCVSNGMKTDAVQRFRDYIGPRKGPIDKNVSEPVAVEQPSTAIPVISNHNIQPVPLCSNQPASSSSTPLSSSFQMFNPFPTNNFNVALNPLDTLCHLTKNDIYKQLNIPCTNPVPFISEIARGYKQLCLIRKTANGLTDNSGLSKLIAETSEVSEGTYDDRTATIKTDLALVSEMLNNFFIPLSRFSVESKWQMFRTFFAFFLIAEKGVHTARVFPQMDDPRILFSCRYYLDIDNIERYFNVESCKSDPAEVASLFEKMFRQFGKIIYNKMRELDLSDEEVAGIFGSLFWSQSVDFLSPAEAELAKQTSEAIFDELYYVCRCRVKGLDELGIRFGGICGLIPVIRKSAHDIVERFSVANVLNIFDVDTFMHSFIPYSF